MNGKLTRKDKCTVNVGNHLHTYMISKQVIVRRGEHKYRILEMHLKLRNQQLKTTLYIYRLLNQNVMGNANQKLQWIHTHKKSNPNSTLKIFIKLQEKRTKEEGKKKDLQKQAQNN